MLPNNPIRKQELYKVLDSKKDNLTRSLVLISSFNFNLDYLQADLRDGVTQFKTSMQSYTNMSVKKRLQEFDIYGVIVWLLL